MINELRIGNWIYDSEDAPHYFQVEEIKKEKAFKSLCVVYRNGSFKVFDPEPIPLTEEILLKCGFEKEPMAYSINIDSFGGGKKLSFSGDYLYIIDSEKKNTPPTDVITLWNKDLRKEFYLHDLQNIFHALTNTELNIKL